VAAAVWVGGYLTAFGLHIHPRYRKPATISHSLHRVAHSRSTAESLVGLTRLPFYVRADSSRIRRSHAACSGTGQARAARFERVTLGSSGDAVITTDIEGRVTLILNRVAESLTGWSHQDALEQPARRSVFGVFNEGTTRRPSEESGDTGTSAKGIVDGDFGGQSHAASSEKKTAI
jgi:hypothetical protein